MNVQHPSFPPHFQHLYGSSGYTGQTMSHPETMAQQFPSDFSQNQFQQPGAFPHAATPPRPAHPNPNPNPNPTSNPNPQGPGQIPPHLYQQLQQQQFQQQQPAAGFVRPPTAQGQAAGQSSNVPQSRSQSAISQSNAPHTPQRPGGNVQQNPPMNPNMNMSMMQQSAAGLKVEQPSAAPSMRTPKQDTSSPPSQHAEPRERERVATLLEINAHLLQEVANLQAQGKAGQPSPTSPKMEGNSPDERKMSSPQEYQECMRRLQANLAYLAAIADANKKAQSQRPVGPAIMIPPTHLTSVHPLYQRLRALFPEASESTLNKAMAVANAQAANARATQGMPQQQQQQQAMQMAG